MGLFQDVFESGDGGVFVNLRDSALNGLTSTSLSGKQALDVNVANSIMVGVPDKTAFIYGTSSFQPIGGVFQDTSPALTGGTSGAARLTANRALHVNVRDAAGNPLGDSNADGFWVKSGDGTNSQAYSATLEAFTQIRQGGNVANVNASNQLLVADANAASILSRMTSSAAALTQVAVTTTSAVLLASNASRKGFSVVNDTNKVIYLAMAATATTAAYSFRLQPNSYYETIGGTTVYTGAIAVIGATGVTGNATVTEYT